MARRRRLKKGGGDLEVHKQNVASLELTISEQNVVPSKLRPREKNVISSELKITSNLCGLELTMMIIVIQMVRSFSI